MVIQRGTVNKHIIKKNKDKFTQIFMKSLVHQTLKCSRGIGEAKGHDQEFIMSLV